MTNEPDVIRINNQVSIPTSELSFRFSRSGGPGGQHVNRSETQVELLFDLAGSPSLSEADRWRARGALGSRVDSDGTLHVVSSESRSQHRNRQEAINRFQQLMASALTVRRKRRPTRPSRAAHERRLEHKQRLSDKKRLRRRRHSDW
jgi:ribosome-associated protein